MALLGIELTIGVPQHFFFYKITKHLIIGAALS